MQQIGKYRDRTVYWVPFEKYKEELPENNWICMAIANEQPDYHVIEDFTRATIAKEILEFKGCGKYGEKLHDTFDDVVNLMEIMEHYPESDVMTTWHNDQSLADVFWQCFFVTCIPDDADWDNLKVVCTDMDGVDRREELKVYLQKFEEGWLPRH